MALMNEAEADQALVLTRAATQVMSSILPPVGPL